MNSFIELNLEESPTSDICKNQVGQLKIIPIGGLGEIGGNLLYIEYLGDAFVFDMGILFPHSNMYGIDFVLPDYSYLLANKDKIKGLIFSHGHDDHIGAAAFIIPQLNNVPIYAGKLTIEFLKAKFEEASIDYRDYTFIEVESCKHYDLSDKLRVLFFRTIHSICDSFAIALDTKWGYVMHSADFKIDPMYIYELDLKALSYLRDKGVFLLMSDSTYADVKGLSISEKVVYDNIKKMFSTLKGRFIFSTFSSSFYRIKNIVENALAFNKKLAFSGYSMLRNVNIYRDIGYLKIPGESIVPIEKIYDYDQNELVIIATGSQGEPNSALSLIAADMHRHIRVEKNDIYVISASPIPGNEVNVIANINLLMKKGAQVIYNFRNSSKYDFIVHASGHGYEQELRMLLNLVKPRYFMPVHGEYRHLVAHKDIAVSIGIKEENIFLLTDGEILEFCDNISFKRSKMHLNKIVIENGLQYNYDMQIQKERKILSNHGILALMYIYQIYEDSINLIDVAVSTRGFFYEDDIQLQELIKYMLFENAKVAAKRVDIYNKEYFKNYIKNRVKNFIKKHLGHSPFVLVNLINLTNGEKEES